MKIVIMIVILALTSCGRAPDMDKAFSRLYWKFENKAYKHGRTTRYVSSIKFGPTKPGVSGSCKRGAIKRITINKTSWMQLSQSKRKILLWHELGHCALKRKHTINRNNGLPSIMHPQSLTVITPAIWSNKMTRQTIIGELFSAQ